MNLYRYYQHDGFRCETIVGIVKAKDMQEAEKIVKNHYEKASKEDMDRNVGTALLHIITGILLTGKTTAYLGK